MVLGMVLGFSGIKIHSSVNKTVSAFAACYSPLAMLLTGIVIAKYDIKGLFNEKKIYLLTLISLQ